MIAGVMAWFGAHQAALWVVLFGVSELLGFSAKGGIFAGIYDFLKGKVQLPKA